eukprot:XP_019924677.1 PREDICTED: uncharacterized protein LOC105332752 [Crassostrea gigas]
MIKKVISIYSISSDYTGIERSIQIKSRKHCHQKPVDSLKIGLGISGAIVLVGVTLIIIWKILSLVYDKVEYSKFETEIKDLIWEPGNPIYKDCTTTAQNPTTNYSRLINPENQNKYEGIGNTKIGVHEYKKLEEFERKESNIPETQNKHDKMKQTRVSSHEYLQIEEEMKEANHDTTDTPEKLKKYDKIDQSQADVQKYTKLDEAEEIELDIPDNYDEINEGQIAADHYMEISQI